LRNAYVIRADDYETDANGDVSTLYCSYDPDTLGKNPADGRKVKGVIHWVESTSALDCEVRLYDRLFSEEQPGTGGVDFVEHLNPNSLRILSGCKAEASLASAPVGVAFQFEREGYFCLDEAVGDGGVPVFNRTISLRDSWGGGN